MTKRYIRPALSGLKANIRLDLGFTGVRGKKNLTKIRLFVIFVTTQTKTVGTQARKCSVWIARGRGQCILNSDSEVTTMLLLLYTVQVFSEANSPHHRSRCRRFRTQAGSEWPPAPSRGRFPPRSCVWCGTETLRHQSHKSTVPTANDRQMTHFTRDLEKRGFAWSNCYKPSVLCLLSSQLLKAKQRNGGEWRGLKKNASRLNFYWESGGTNRCATWGPCEWL